MDAQIPKGVYAAVLTPLDQNLNCHDELLFKHASNLIERGCQGIVLFGTTGEGASFSVREKTKTLAQVLYNGLKPKNVIVGNGSQSLSDTVELCQEACDFNCLACLISPPCFYKNVSQEGVISYYREVIHRTKNPLLRILLYHIPQYTGVPITPTILKALISEFPDTVIGVKESEGNFALVKEYLKEVPTCKVFVGKEKLIPEAVKVGAWGSICGFANIFPELIVKLYENGDQEALQKAWKLFENRPFISSCKALLAYKKKEPLWNKVRPPLIPLNENDAQALVKYID